jgi:hypothetical protein
MKITYEFETKRGSDEFDFEVDDTSEIIEQCFRKEFGTNLTQTRELIDELDLWESLEERYEDEIKEHFEEEAYEMYKDQREYESDPYSYYGVSRSDFI